MNERAILKKLQTGSLTVEDLRNPTVLEVVEKFLMELYPNLDVSSDPADMILNSSEFRAFIDELVGDE